MNDIQNLNAGDLSKGGTVPGANYRLRINKSEMRQPKDESTGDKYPFVNVDFVIQDEGEFFGRHIFQNFTLKPGANWGLRGLIDAMGLPPETPVVQDGVYVLGSHIDNGEVNGVVVEKPAGKGADGKEYDAQNQVKKFISIW